MNLLLGAMEYVKLAVYYASFLYFLAAPLLLFLVVRRRGRSRILAGAALVATTVLAYARFVEPRFLVTRSETIPLQRCFADAGSLRLALVSDLHVGLFRNGVTMERLAAAIAKEKPDAVLIAGDLTYHLAPSHFAAAFAPLVRGRAPVYAVLGNHDVGFPGPDVGAPLTASLQGLGVRMIDNRAEMLATRTGAATIVGVSDLWQDRQDYEALAFQSPVPRIVLTHNPETAYIVAGVWRRPGPNSDEERPRRPRGLAGWSIRRAPDALYADLLLAGHTHGGQIRVPPLTCVLLRMACAP
ncbi:MAG: metallophosphoesterase, partial [Parvularculaceae bacterium]|nr:metallophosphoesterase [Parvularculaceae bacterium]